MKDHHPEKTHLEIFVAWFWFALTFIIALTGFILFIRNAGTPVPASWGVESGTREGTGPWSNAFLQSILSPTLIGFLGSLILTKRSGHRIGRLLVILGLVSALGIATSEWAIYGYYTLETTLPGTAIAAWITNWFWVIMFSILLLTAALFPDGNFVSRRWGWGIGISLFLFTIPLLLGAMLETPMTSAFQIPNPFITNHPETLYNFLFTTGVVAMPVTAVLVLVSAVVRFRNSQARKRRQMKWLMYGVALMAIMTLIGLGLSFIFENTFGEILVNISIIGPAIGVGMALLRHQLYDIDILIRRTLQYTLLTGLLALIYFGGVIILQWALRPFTDAANSPLITVITTLAIAALFNPLRHRIQEFIDRRFYRKKYDAQQTLTQFAATARDEVELGRLTGALIHVVEETMKPETVSLWIKQTSGE